MESYSGSPSSPEKWPGISPSRRWAAKVLRTCARLPTRPCASARPGAATIACRPQSDSHGKPARMVVRRRSAATKTSARLAISSKTGSDVDANSRRRRSLGVEEMVGIARDLLEREDGERLRVRAQRPLPLERAPEVFVGVVAARGLLGVAEVPVPGRLQARRPEDAAEEEARQVGQRLHPARFAADLGRRVPVARFLLEPMRSPEGQQRADAEVGLGGPPVRPPDDRHGPFADDAERTFDRELAGLVEPRREGLEAKSRQRLRSRRPTARPDRPASRDSWSSRGRSRTLRSPRPSSSAGAAEEWPARTSRGSGGSSAPRRCRTRILPARPLRAIRGRGRGLEAPRRTIPAACGRYERQRWTRRCSRQVGEALSGGFSITPLRGETSRGRAVAPGEPRRLRGLFMRARNKIGRRRFD